MSELKHISAASSHYDLEAESYDSFNEENAAIINKTIENVLAKKKVKSVLDLTCGTGAQVFWLSERGYEVSGYDINEKMLAIAKAKAEKFKLEIPFSTGDMRRTQAGSFDAVLTIFNSVGHLTCADFEKTIRNVHANLKVGGLYLFDIFNLEYLLHKDNITKLTIDWQKVVGDKTFREIQYSTISQDGVLASYDIYYETIEGNLPEVKEAIQTLQIYSSEQLQTLLGENGFRVIFLSDIDGSEFSKIRSERIFIVAEKV